jgi:hypothetical protein
VGANLFEPFRLSTLSANSNGLSVLSLPRG